MSTCGVNHSKDWEHSKYLNFRVHVSFLLLIAGIIAEHFHTSVTLIRPKVEWVLQGYNILALVQFMK